MTKHFDEFAFEKHNTSVMEFAVLAKYIMANRGLQNAAVAAEASSREGNLGPKLARIARCGTSLNGISRQVLLQNKAAVPVSGLSGSPLADYTAIASGFVASLVNADAFDTMLPSMVPVPLATGQTGAITVGATGYSLGEGSAKPISGMTIASQMMTPMKAHGAIVITDELARTPLGGGTQLIANSLRRAVAKITDAAFITAITSGVAVTASLGTTPDAVRQTIATLLGQVSLGQGSAPFLITTPAICEAWCMLSTGGQSAFPNLGPMGGTINGIPVLVSDGVLSGQVILADASGIAAAPGEVALQDFREGVLVADSAPDSPQLASTTVESLWQANKVAVVVERFFCAVKLRPDAVALASGVSNSPA